MSERASDIATCTMRKLHLFSFANASTIKQDCKAGIKLSLSDDGQDLVVNEVNEDHNHDICKVSQFAHIM